MTILTGKDELVLAATGPSQYRLNSRELRVEFGLPGGRLEVLRVEKPSGPSSPGTEWTGTPPRIAEPLRLAEGTPVFELVETGTPETTIRAEWRHGPSFFRWVLVIHKDPPGLECRMEMSPDRAQLLEAALGRAQKRQRPGTAFDTIEHAGNHSGSVDGEDLLATVSIGQKHVRLTGVHLHDITDHFDYLVEERTLHSGHRGSHAFTGNLLQCTNLVTAESLLLARLAPTPEAHFTRRNATDFHWVNGRGVAVYGTGISGLCEDHSNLITSYGLLLLPAAADALPGAWRAHYRQRMQRAVFSDPLCLSNTWGDRNQDAALNASFARKELEALKVTGIRGLMLDDGWQAGVTANSKLASGGLWEGYHAADSRFWRVHPEKFPDGLEPLVEAARKAGKELALWFSPDSSNDFANWEEDAAILLDLYHRHGIRAFKLDGIKLRTRLGERRFGWLLDALDEGSDGAIVPVLDVTSEVRQGYFREIDHGILFLENRYTDWGNYYPYRTLRSIWQLSRWIPAQRLHIEFLNPRRNRETYDGDPFAPEHYPISYLYALTMVGHPLAWMEVQHLAPGDREHLRPVSEWHAANHRRLLSADIEPVGELPDGRSWSGFVFHFPDGGTGVLVFRDNAKCNTLELPLEVGGKLVRQVGSVEAGIGQLPGGEGIRIRLPARRAWAFFCTE
jgi:alpha-galactosidase